MKTGENLGSLHNTSMISPSFDPFSYALFPLPDLLGENDFLNYQSYSEVSKQSNQSHYLNPQTQMANGPTQAIQSQFNCPLHQHHQTISRKIINPDYGTTQVNSAFSLFADCHTRHGKREGILKSNTSGVAPSENKVWRGAINSSSEYGGGTSRKFRIRWTHELHDQFVEAVNSLGGPMKATPKGILELMKPPGLTTFHIKSHLQKYRTASGVPSSLEGRSGKSICPGLPLSNMKGRGLQISETLRLQMNVRKSLHEHLEFQKKLQTRIEDHANYLQQVFDRQKESCSYLQKHTSNKVINPFNGEL